MLVNLYRATLADQKNGKFVGVCCCYFYINISLNILQEAKRAYADKTINRECQLFRNSAMFSRCDWRCTVNHLLCKKGYFSYLAISRKALKHESILKIVKLFQLGTFLLAAITVHRNCCFPHQQKV